MVNQFGYVLTAAILSIGVAGCKQDIGPQTDDARKRAIAEGVDNKQAAQYYFYQLDNESYAEGYDSGSANDAVQDAPAAPMAPASRVPDFFPGMDAIVDVDARHHPDYYPDQLLDQVPKKSGKVESPSSVADNTPIRPLLQIAPANLDESETIGRNTWMLWCAGNEGFWDWLCTDSLGFIDLLKLVDSRQRETRFANAGLINEPGMRQARSASRDEFGLWLDLPADPKVLKWREAFVSESFDQIGKGLHKSQVGLKQKSRSGKFDGPEIYRGAPDAFRNEHYRYPSSYLTDANDAGVEYGYAGSNASTTETQRYYQDLDQTVPPPDMYGISSGVVGLRLFPNPYFDDSARERWNAEKFYSDPDYYNDPMLIRPYRVGMSCAFCHASFHPLRPPTDIGNPKWENISGNIGAQYLSMRATVGGQLTPDQFVYHLLESQPRGTIDTSLIASDNINNPNTMNAVFGLPERALLSLHNPRERLTKESARLPSLWKHPDPRSPGDGVDVVPEKWNDVAKGAGLEDELAHSNDRTRHVPRILLDGSDSIGTWGALARVYLNIGSYWEQWNQLHQVVLGFAPQRPFLLADCEQHSVYWNSTELRVPGLRDYFLKVTPTMPLLSTPNGEQRISATSQRANQRASHVDISQLELGRKVFAKNCIVCHSSIQPESTNLVVTGISVDESLVEDRLRIRNQSETDGEFWEHDPNQWLTDRRYEKWAMEIVQQPAFWVNNYLSTDYRIPINVVNTNAARAMGTNAMTGHMWQDFASESYRKLSTPGTIDFFNPYKGESGEMDQFSPRHINPETGERDGGGGPGYYRVPTLMSIWATAPFLHNNSLGLFNNDPSVEGRLAAFDDAMQKMLWPEKRLRSSSYNGATAERLKRDHGLIWRTTETSYLSIDGKRVPGFVHRLPWLSKLHERKGLQWLDDVAPFYLPTLILFIGAFLVLAINKSEHRKVTGTVIILFSVIAATGLWLMMRWPMRFETFLAWLPQPIWLLFGLVLIVGLTLWLRRFRRLAGYALGFCGLLIGIVIYFDAGQLGGIRIGPIPAGTPVNLLANFNSEADRRDQLESVKTLIDGLAEIESRHLSAKDRDELLRTKIAPALMAVNKCPDFVMDKGHYFPWFDSITDKEKYALIELLKTF